MQSYLSTDRTIKLILNFIKNRISIFSLIDRKIILKETIKYLQILLDDIDGSIKIYNSYNEKQTELELWFN